MISLALIAVVEAIVLQARYRSAVVGGPFVAAWWTFATQALRVVWLSLGVSAFLAGSDVVLVIAAYGFPAAATVGVMRAMEEKRQRPWIYANEKMRYAIRVDHDGRCKWIDDQERADAEKHTP